MSNNTQANLLFEDELNPRLGMKIPVGIHTKCSVTSVEVGDGFVDINFENEDGQYHNVRLWEPKGKYPREIKDKSTGASKMETTDEAITRETRQNLGHLAALTNIFLEDEEKDSLKASLAKKPAYEDVVRTIAAQLNPVLDKYHVNLKLIPDSEGKYSTFPKYAYAKYIERYEEGVEPTLEFSEYEQKLLVKAQSKPERDPLVDDLLA